MTSAIPPPDEGGAAVLIALARLEGKVDAALATQGAQLAEHGRRLDDHEPRLRAVENRPTVSPRAMWTALGTLAAIVAALTPLVSRLFA
ncbi:hypothetical protein Acy02nite_68540 [Actinoplanes cyaneus]|uniref:Uncharacterized protein n=1 Tax=Actinoplanes cyaneus TaxID=52696 RepID=A0A919IP93_9ACTN|nr:hypothetical protein [Actinoplanes cyaneus]MCW2139097.1 hypothetical protein [Actinoplanes cyaneus]GID68973.1 hypothetical protein Acy02nite_68540 [Actinoplanes cyaneus]